MQVHQTKRDFLKYYSIKLYRTFFFSLQHFFFFLISSSTHKKRNSAFSCQSNIRGICYVFQYCQLSAIKPGQKNFITSLREYCLTFTFLSRSQWKVLDRSFCCAFDMASNSKTLLAGLSELMNCVNTLETVIVIFK